ncbi:HlyD family efflux transporter periplasmic adaptor subunit [Martelella alba]|uniref:HlyD family efflux transporter periplasmic adaptor subunit n=1 Tax=Martelella alba TaxID=2590451 RepID=A0A506UJ72_9HYPH|nr:HlyD family efflux transporter periplasmic adaptor subunit [Martelella alba]TPW33375.1 HlyD family efflux transporter periplasmic adaptor subunit [Martelella alba]
MNQNEEPNLSEAQAMEAAAPKRSRRGPAFAGLLIVVVACAGGFAAYDRFYASEHVSTDNAYVGAETAEITPLVAAPVAEVLVSDAEHVKKGDVLVRLDDTDAKLQLAMAEANYQSAIRRVQGYQARDRALQAQTAAQEAGLDKAKASLEAAEAGYDKARIDYERRKDLVERGSVSGDELTASETAMKTAKADLAAAKAGLAVAAASIDASVGNEKVNATLIEGTGVDDNPEVLAAKAARDQAKVNLDRTVIQAPVDGIVSERSVQIGERVQPGQRIMVVVPVNDVYVDANFKEIQLRDVKPGQQVTLHADLYGSDVTYDGTVVGFTGGTGSAFSVVPAQNATGNWIKVVQRLPVRIALEPQQLTEHPLAVGLSMNVDIHL